MHHAAITAPSSTFTRGFSFNAVLNRIVAAIEVAHQRRALGKLSAEALEDLGISRTEANLEASRPFWA